MSEKRTFLKASSHYLTSQIVVLCISLISFPIVVRLLSVEDYGVLSLCSTWMKIFFLLLLDFCVRIRKAGLKVLYWPNLEIFHDIQWISHKKPFSKVSRSHFFGLVYYFRKHGGWFSNNHRYR